MRSSIRRVGEIALALLALGFLAALVVPWRQSDSEEALLTGSAGSSPVSVGEVMEPIRATPDALTELFVTREPVAPVVAAPAAAPAPVEKKPVAAPWLRYIGNIAGAEGTSYHFFKDTRSGRSIALSQGEIVNGWSLVEAGDTAFTLRNNDDLYTVNKK